ncbi:MAG: hypothetical protein K1X88_24730 [Nannocystaceae bacterium]|nr:hypothetical protein [Nannocystaceae bacterium]
MTSAVVPCEPWRELALHVLAHVPLRDAGSLFDPAYLQWTATLGLHEPTLHHDGAVIAGLVAHGPDAPIHRVPLLFAALSGFERVRARTLAELAPADVDDAALLATLQSAPHPGFELLWLGCALALPRWRAVFDQTLAPSLQQAAAALRERLQSVAVPSLHATTVQLSSVLGPRGRGFPDAIVVGAPAPWHGGELDHVAMMVLHEHAVRDLAPADADWATAEFAALVCVADWLASGPAALAVAHRRWVDALALTAMIATLRQTARLDDATATALQHGARYDTLLALAARGGITARAGAPARPARPDP